jgi:hypothetical protein
MFAPYGHDLVGRILQPGPQTAGQGGVEAGSGGGLAPQECKHLMAAGSQCCASRGFGPSRRARCHGDHRCSVPTSCDTSSTLTGGWHLP